MVFRDVNLHPYSAGVRDVKRHRWFAGLDWIKLERKAVRAPIIPHLRGTGATRPIQYTDCVRTTWFTFPNIGRLLCAF